MTDRSSPDIATPEMVKAAYKAYGNDEILTKSDDWLEAVINAALAASPARSSADNEALAIEIEKLIFKNVRVVEVFGGADTFVGTTRAADEILALITNAAQAAPERGNRFCNKFNCPYPDCLDGGVCSSQPSPLSSTQGEPGK